MVFIGDLNKVFIEKVKVLNKDCNEVLNEDLFLSNSPYMEAF